jgi:pyruvate kinase
MNTLPTRTKIVATVGPATGEPAMLRRLVDAGVDVFRLNFSHGDTDTHAGYVRDIRRVAGEAGVQVAILQDLQGPRIRTGRLLGGGPVTLAADTEVVLRPGSFDGDASCIAVSYEGLPHDVSVGDVVLIADGLLELRVIASDEREVCCRVVIGGELGERKGMNLPQTKLGLTAPTLRDIQHLRLGVELNVDYVALSFVAGPQDVQRLREEMHAVDPAADIPIISKIERPVAVEKLGDILRVSDAVMVARGDLGIELPAERVPIIQKQIIRAANAVGKPVITATQMLESMVQAPRPTRAEATDVANAILDGTDAVMLSAETSIGAYPVETVRMMDRIARQAERLQREGGGVRPPRVEGQDDPIQHALARAACQVAEETDAAAIVVFTTTGGTARHIAQRRPHTAVFALTPNDQTRRRLSLVWGVEAIMVDVFASTDTMVAEGLQRLGSMQRVKPGQTVVCVAGPSSNTAGGTDMLKIHRFSPQSV